MSANPQPGAGGFVEVECFAKINLFLNIVGKLPDGYHQLETVMHKINLRDTLTVARAKAGVTLEVVGDNPLYPIDKIPTSESNLVVKVARRMLAEYNIMGGLRLTLVKRIPMGAGLGGGSADCAGAILAIAKLFKLPVTMDKLLKLGKTLGADVPFCLFANAGGVAAKATGIGEDLVPIAPAPKCYMLLACLKIHVSTKVTFGNLNWAPGVYPEKSLADYLAGHYNGDLFAQGIYNIFTEVTGKVHPQVPDIINNLKKQGAIAAEMTGTGPTIYAFFDNEDTANHYKKVLQGIYRSSMFFVVKTF